MWNMHDTIVTLEELAGAIEQRLGLPHAQATDDAERVLDFFGTHTHVLDNRLDNEDRQIFYTLQLEGLLTIHREETELWNGQPWRSLSWVLRTDRIHTLATERAATRQRPTHETDAAAGVYATLPDDAWARRSVPTA